jgi:hypothetical protein
MIDRPPGVVLDNRTFVAWGKPQLTFINSGNRAAAITGIGASAQNLSRADPAAEDCNKQDKVFRISFDTPPFVVNAGEIHAIEAGVQASGPTFISVQKDGSLRIPGFGFKEGDQLLICFELNLATPDSYVQTWRHLAYIMKIQDSLGNFTPLFEQNKPIVIQKSSWLKHLEAELKRFNREKSDRP